MDDLPDLIVRLLSLGVLLLPWLVRMVRRAGGRVDSAGGRVDNAGGRADSAGGRVDSADSAGDTKSPGQPSPVSGPSGAEAPRPSASQAAPSEQVAAVQVDALLDRAYQLASSLERKPSYAGLLAALQDSVIDPLEGVRQARARGPEPDPDMEAAEALQDRLNAIATLVAARPEDGTADLALALERVAADLYLPLCDFASAQGVGLLGGTPHVVMQGAGRPHRMVAEMGLSVFRVAPGFGQRLSDWAELSRMVGERWVFELEGFAPELYQRMRLHGAGRAVRLPAAQVGYDPASVYACFGAWLPALVAEMMATLRLGSAHVTGLRLRTAGRPATVARARGAYLSSEPPPLLLMTAGLRVLEARGFHLDARAERAAFEAAAGDLGRARLPLQDGAVMELESVFLTDLTKQVTDVVLGHGFECLDGFHLHEIPGFAHTPHERAVQRALAADPARLATGHDEPARVLGAVLRLATGRPRTDEALVPALRHALAHDAAEARGVDRPAAPASLSAALRDPDTLIEAIVFAEALGRRHN